MKYRIIEKEQISSESSEYYIMKQRRFLFWTYWVYLWEWLAPDYYGIESYATYEEALKELNRKILKTKERIWVMSEHDI